MKIAQLVVSALLLFLLVAACAPKVAPAPAAPAPAPLAAPAPAKPAAPAAAAKPAWEMEWDNTVRAAKREGVVVWLTTTSPETRRLVSQGFKSTYGITVESVAAAPGQLATKILAERRAGLYTSDVALMGFTAPISALKPAGVLERLDTILLLPELTDPKEIQKVWGPGGLLWIDDRDHTMLAFAPYVKLNIWINTMLVKPGEIQSYADVLDPKWKGKIIMGDPTVGSGSPINSVQGISLIMGWDYLRKIAGQQLLLTRDERQGPEWLARGKYAIGFGLKDSVFADLVAAGAPVASVAAKEGEAITPGSSVIIVMKNAAHPNAAKLFANWLLTKEGQIAYCTGYGAPSGRLDVTIEGLFLTRPDPKQKYVWTGSEEVYKTLPEVVKMAKEIFEPLRK